MKFETQQKSNTSQTTNTQNTFNEKLGHRVNEPKRVCTTTLPELLSFKKSLEDEFESWTKDRIGDPPRKKLEDIKERVVEENDKLNEEFSRLFDLYVHRGVEDPCAMRNLDRLVRRNETISQFGYSLPTCSELEDYRDVRNLNTLRRREYHLPAIGLGTIGFLAYVNRDIIVQYINYGKEFVERFL